MRHLLSIENLSVAFRAGGQWVPVVRDVSLRVCAGDFVGLVGESGSGKSVTALSVLRLLPSSSRIVDGRIELEGSDLLGLSEDGMRVIRGGRIGMVFQEPMTALNPVFTIGFQLAEAVRAHRPVGRSEARSEAERLLELVAISPSRDRLDDYPHQLSGGQLQRVVIAMALAGEPELLIADEPTSALDVTIQAQILDLLEDLRDQLGLGVLLITHDLGIVAGTCRRVSVMYAGQIVEESATEELFRAPVHPYAKGLLRSVPRLGSPEPRGQLSAIDGQAPEPHKLPGGCSFHPRCPEVMDRCRVEEPLSMPKSGNGAARCFLVEPQIGVGANGGEEAT